MKLKLVILAILILSFTACRTSRTLPPVNQVTIGRTQTDSISEVTVDSYTRADSAQMIAEVDSDDQGNIVLKNILEYTPGENVIPIVRIKDSLIYVKCRVDSAEVYKRYSRFSISTADTSSKVEIIPNPGNKSYGGRTGFFHRCLHTAGYLFLAELLILAGYLIFKLKKIFTFF